MKKRTAKVRSRSVSEGEKNKGKRVIKGFNVNTIFLILSVYDYSFLTI